MQAVQDRVDASSGGLSARSPKRLTARTASILMIVTALAALAIRVALANYSMWFDELASMFFSEQPLSRLWSGWIVRESNPPLFYSMLHVWVDGFGPSLMAVRMLPIAGGLIGIGLLAVFCSRYLDARTASIVVVLAALSPQQVYFSELIRGYIFAFDGMVLSLIGLFMILYDGPTPRMSALSVGLYAAGAALAIYSHTTMVLWPVATTLAAFLTHPRPLLAERMRRLGLLVVGDAIVVLLAAWWLVVSLKQASPGNQNINWIVHLGWNATLHTIVNTIFLIRGNQKWVTLTQALIGSLAVVAVALGRPAATTRCIAATAVILLVLFLGMDLVHPVLTIRTAFLLSVTPLILIGIGLSAVPHAALRWALVSLVVAALCLNLSRGRALFLEEDFLGAVRDVAAAPHGVLLVEGEAMGIVTQQACRVAFPTRPCPIRIVTTEPRIGDADRWADGMLQPPPIAWADLPRAIGADDQVFTFRHVIYDPAARLRGLPPRKANWWDPYLDGPFKAADFAGSP